MRISIVLPMRPREPSGGLLVQYQFADWLAAQGHTPTLVHPWRLRVQTDAVPRSVAATVRWRLSPNEIVPWHSFHPGVKVTVVPWLAASFLPRADVTVLTGWETSAALRSSNRRTGPFAQVVYDYEHWMSADHLGRQRIERALQRDDVQHIATSGAVRSMLDKVGVPVVATVPPGVPVDRFSCRKPPGSRPLSLGFAYRPEAFKAMPDLFEALEQVHDLYPDAPVRCFGKSGAKEVPHWVQHLGLLTDQEVADFYNDCAIFILPSHYEGWGLTAAEAMASGSAVVATGSGGVSDFINNEEDALVVPPRDSRALGQAIIRLIEGPELRSRLGEAGASRLATMGWERSGPALLRVLTGVAVGPRTSPPRANWSNQAERFRPRRVLVRTGLLAPAGDEIPPTPAPTTAAPRPQRAGQEVIFLVGQFRSGSTMFWNLLRSTGLYTCYYEPLHERLLQIVENPANAPHDTTHVGVEDYFAEYRCLDRDVLERLWKGWFSSKRFLLDEEDGAEDLAEYIDFLGSSGRKPVVIKFTRATLRARWLKHRFPAARLIYITRGPRDNWTSMLGRVPLEPLSGTPGRLGPRLSNTATRVGGFDAYVTRIAADIGLHVSGDPYRMFYAMTRLANELTIPVADDVWSYEAAVSDFDGWCQAHLVGAGLAPVVPDVKVHRESLGEQRHPAAWYQRQEAAVNALVGPSAYEFLVGTPRRRPALAWRVQRARSAALSAVNRVEHP